MAENFLPTLNMDVGVTSYVFPSDLLPPDVKKTKNYALTCSKAMYWRHTQSLGLVTNTRRNDWIINRQWAEGNIDVTKFVSRISKLKNEAGQNISYLDLSWIPPRVISKFRDIVLSYLDKIEYDIFCDAINPEAEMDRQMAKYRIWTEKELLPFFQAQAKKSGAPLDQTTSEFIPDSMQELELFMQYTFRLQYEISMELGQQMVLYENDWKEIKKMLLEDAFDNGVMATCVYVDRISGRLKLRYADPVNMIMEDFRGHKGTMTRIGEFRLMTVAQLKLEAGNQFTEQEYYEIAKSHIGRYTNPSTITPYNEYINTDQTDWYYNYDNFMILVQDWDWDTVDRYKFRKQTVYGDTKVFSVPFDTKIEKKESRVDEFGNLIEKEVYATDIKQVYSAKWIVNTDFIYDYGVSANIPRPLENPREAYKRYKFYRITKVSMLERMIPFAEALFLGWLKIQNLKARALPQGIVIEQGAFDNVFIDGKKKTQEELLQMGFQTGVWVYRKQSNIDDDYDPQASKPIERFEGGLGSEFSEMVNDQLFNIQQLREVTGINELMDASTPNPKTLVGIANYAVAGSQNALHPIMSGFIAHHEDICSSISLLIQLVVKYKGGMSGYAPAIGSIPAQILNIGSEVANNDNMTPVMYGTRIVARATQEQKQRIMEVIGQMVANDPSLAADYIELSRMIENGTNLKLIAAIFQRKLMLKQQQAQQFELQKIQEQNKGIEAQTLTAKKEEERLLLLKKELDDDSYTKKTDNDIRKLREEYLLRGVNDQVKGNVKIGVERDKAVTQPLET